jgi:hypothetical protein
MLSQLPPIEALCRPCPALLDGLRGFAALCAIALVRLAVQAASPALLGTTTLVMHCASTLVSGKGRRLRKPN